LIRRQALPLRWTRVTVIRETKPRDAHADLLAGALIPSPERVRDGRLGSGEPSCSTGLGRWIGRRAAETGTHDGPGDHRSSILPPGFIAAAARSRIGRRPAVVDVKIDPDPVVPKRRVGSRLWRDRLDQAQRADGESMPHVNPASGCSRVSADRLQPASSCLRSRVMHR